MTSAVSEKLQRRTERKELKREEKKAQIATSAQLVLQELGYANTSLRDIAARADLSLGSLHYYFEDRTQLILYCVRAYKTTFSERLQASIAHVSGRDAIIDAFAESLTTSIIEDATTHRLWYDIRVQALFDPVFRPVVEEIETMLINAVDVAADKAGVSDPALSTYGYPMIDGLFRFHMQNAISGNGLPRDRLVEEMRRALARIF